MASVLSLPGFANLVSMKEGEVVLIFNGLRYGRDEVVPTALLSVVNFAETSCSASVYVEHCMTRKFGADRHGWPALAQEFVHAPAE
jgi:hypothetical protein